MSAIHEGHSDNEKIIYRRAFTMPSHNTFELCHVAALLRVVFDEFAEAHGRAPIVVDPFARNSKLAGQYSNDLNPNTSAHYHMHAVEFLDKLIADGLRADIVLLDPPYSPRQVSECYNGIGLKPSQKDTQTAVLYKECKDRMDMLLVVGGRAVCCGWNTMGFGICRGYRMNRVLIVTHGGAHNDTLVTVETKGGTPLTNCTKRKLSDVEITPDE